MELELKKLEDTVRAIHEEMFYLRARFGGRNARFKQNNEFKNGVVELPFALYLFISGRAPGIRRQRLMSIGSEAYLDLRFAHYINLSVEHEILLISRRANAERFKLPKEGPTSTRRCNNLIMRASVEARRVLGCVSEKLTRVLPPSSVPYRLHFFAIRAEQGASRAVMMRLRQSINLKRAPESPVVSNSSSSLAFASFLSFV
ncbi:hypothetical protein ACLOJK_036774 [Asimina triloba]